MPDRMDEIAEAVADRLRTLRGLDERETRFSTADMMRLTRSAVAKIDVMGPRGTTLCTMDEIEAMACAIVTGGLLPEYNPKPADETATEGDDT